MFKKIEARTDIVTKNVKKTTNDVMQKIRMVFLTLFTLELIAVHILAYLYITNFRLSIVPVKAVEVVQAVEQK